MFTCFQAHTSPVLLTVLPHVLSTRTITQNGCKSMATLACGNDGGFSLSSVDVKVRIVLAEALHVEESLIFLYTPANMHGTEGQILIAPHLDVPAEVRCLPARSLTVTASSRAAFVPVTHLLGHI